MLTTFLNKSCIRKKVNETIRQIENALSPVFKHNLHREDTPKPSRFGTECTLTFFLMQKKKQKPSGKKTTCTFTAFCSATVDSEGGHPHLEPWPSSPKHKLHFYHWFTLKMAICTSTVEQWPSLALLGSLEVPRPSWALLGSRGLFWASLGLLFSPGHSWALLGCSWGLLDSIGLSWARDASTSCGHRPIFTCNHVSSSHLCSSLFFLWYCARWHVRLVFCAAVLKGQAAREQPSLCGACVLCMGELHASAIFLNRHENQ